MFSRMLPLILSLGALPLPAYAACSVADILFGPIRFDILPHYGEDGSLDYETAIIRSDTFDDPDHFYGAILGEITVDRGGFSLRTPGQVVIGNISPELVIEAADDGCIEGPVGSFAKAQDGIWVIMAGGGPVGTLEGRWPRNGFGVD